MKQFITVFLILISFSGYSQEVNDKYVQEQISRGANYSLVFFKDGRVKEDESSKLLKMDHLKNLFRMERDQTISVFGPLEHEKYRGVIVFNTNDTLMIKKELSKDPFIAKGYMDYEIIPFFSIPGQSLKKPLK
jgi:hypothetical protein